VKEGIVM